MLLQTILNRLHKHKSFVYGTARWISHGESQNHRRAGPTPSQQPADLLPSAAKKGPGYDHVAERRYQFVPDVGLAVFLLYAPRRVDCPHCGVKVERLPWARGKSRLTTMYMWFLAAWAKRLSWQEVAERLAPVGTASTARSR